MEFREATEFDVPTIVRLLKQSLGESLMPKSEDYWRWKHVKNPFGESPVLLCWEKHELIGVRAFMRWEWWDGKQSYYALRAVDTATHPAYQGRGIFKKLTLSLIDLCKAKGDHFIFNTPNSQSKPGYLKMGWIEGGKLPIRMKIERPLNILFNMVSRPSTFATGADTNLINYYIQHPGLNSLLAKHRERANKITTHVSKEYLRWRYSEAPVANYIAIGEGNDTDLFSLVIGRVKDTRWGKELRITDFFWNGNSDSKQLKKELQVVVKNRAIDYVTLSGTTDVRTIKYFLSNSIRLQIGPVVTLREVNFSELNNFKHFKNWDPSIGDLELF